MLRIVKAPYLFPRLMAVKATTASSVLTFNQGIGDFRTGTSSGTGVSTLTFKTALGRLPLCVGSPGSNIANGGYFHSATHAVGSVIMNTDGAAGSADDGTYYGFILGYDAKDTRRYTNIHEVRATVKAPRLLAMTVNGTGTAALVVGKYQATLTDNGTGDYTITFNRPFGSVPIVVATGLNTSTAVAVQVTSVAVDSVNIKTFDNAGTPEDNIFHLWVLGFDSKFESGDLRKPLHTPQRKPRMIAGRVAYSGGVPAISVNSEDITSIADTGTGDATITFKQAFKRAPVCIASGIGDNRVTIHTINSTSVRLVASIANGTATDGDYDFMILGFDNADEFGEV